MRLCRRAKTLFLCVFRLEPEPFTVTSLSVSLIIEGHQILLQDGKSIRPFIRHIGPRPSTNTTSMDWQRPKRVDANVRSHLQRRTDPSQAARGSSYTNRPIRLCTGGQADQ